MSAVVPGGDDFNSDFLLLLLDERPATAPELCARLRQLGLIEDRVDPAQVAVLLQELQTDRLVDGRENGAGAAPVYSLTQEGAERLGVAADDLRSTQILLRRYLARYAEQFVL